MARRSIPTLAVLCGMAVSPTAMAETCEHRSDTDSLRADVLVALGAYREGNWDAFDSRSHAAREGARCLDEVVRPADAVQLHLLEALVAWTARDLGRVADHFCAIRSIEADWALPEAIAPEGHTLWMAFESGQCADDTVSIEPPDLSPDRLAIDGFWAGAIPGDPAKKAYFAQRTTESGRVLGSGMIVSGQEFPWHRAVVEQPPSDSYWTPSRKVGLGFVVGAAGSGGVGAVLVGRAMQGQRHYDDLVLDDALAYRQDVLLPNRTAGLVCLMSSGVMTGVGSWFLQRKRR